MHLTLACVQTNCGSDMATNIAALSAMVRDAAAQGAQWVALPENTFLMEPPGGARNTEYDFAADAHPGVKAMQALARELNVWVLIGSVALAVDDSGKRVNRSLLVDAQGNITAGYDKIHLFDVDLGNGERYAESARILPGDAAVLAATPWGKLGMSVCYDVRFPHLYRALAQAGATLLAVPAAFTEKTGQAHWHTLLRARAIENGCFVIAPAQWGAHPGNRRTYGHSLVIDPWGEILLDGGEGTGVHLATLDLSRIGSARGRMPSLAHDRPFHLREA